MIELSNNIFNYLENHFGKKFAENYKEYVASDFKNYIRISGDINQQNKIAEILSNVGISLSPVNSVPNAYSVESGADKIGKTLEHVLGKYYIQSLSSMIPSLVISPNSFSLLILIICNIISSRFFLKILFCVQCNKLLLKCLFQICLHPNRKVNEY